jgi:hypothetical protein
LRGGAFYFGSDVVRAASRYGYAPVRWRRISGFRVVVGAS